MSLACDLFVTTAFYRVRNTHKQWSSTTAIKLAAARTTSRRKQHCHAFASATAAATGQQQQQYHCYADRYLQRCWHAPHHSHHHTPERCKHYDVQRVDSATTSSSQHQRSHGHTSKSTQKDGQALRSHFAQTARQHVRSLALRGPNGDSRREAAIARKTSSFHLSFRC